MLTPERIQEVLIAVRDIEPLSNRHPVLQVQFVKRELQKLPESCGDYDRLYVLQQIFLRMIQAKLGNYETGFSGGRYEALQTAFATFNQQRQAYIAVFHCYLDPDGTITTAQFALISHFSPRTIRRRLEYGIKLLTFDSIGAELDANNVRNSVEVVPFDKHSQHIEGHLRKF